MIPLTTTIIYGGVVVRSLKFTQMNAWSGQTHSAKSLHCSSMFYDEPQALHLTVQALEDSEQLTVLKEKTVHNKKQSTH